MRSGLAARWMAESGLEVPVIDGGYKALRRYLMAAIRDAARERPLVVIGGRTGVGKTALLEGLPGAVDLEGHARHRGSSFGRRVQAPPTQIDFEHALALDLLRRAPGAAAPLFLEDESRRVGPVSVPLELFRAMGQAPLVIVEAPWADRVERILQEYVIDLRRDYEARDPAQGFSQYSAHLLGSLDRIRKRLGGDRHRRLRAEMEAALDAQLAGSPRRHEAWIGELLTAYYDPMYEYQLSGVQRRVCFRGSWAAVREWCLARV